MRLKRTRMQRYDRFVNGFVAGAGLMYLLDPDRGRRRRGMLRDKGVHLAHQALDASGTTARDLRNRATGVVAEAWSRMRPDVANDAVIEGRVRSQLGRLVSHPGAIEVSVDDGVVTLSGAVLTREMPQLIAGVTRVKGVGDVRHDLSVHEKAGQIPALQGEARKPQHRPELLQENWAPATRLIMGTAGGLLTMRALRAGGPLALLGVLGGGAMLARALTNLDLRRLTGMTAGRRAIDVHKIITVNAPLREVFEFLSDIENLPRFMSHLQEVRNLGGGRSRWTARGPAGVPVTWDAELTDYAPGEVIAWKSVGTVPVGTAGIVRFQPVDEHRTRIDIRMSYNPTAGALGHLVASFFGVDPKHALDDDLVRFKSLLEHGKTTAHGREVRNG